MTVEVFTGPGTETYRSVNWDVTVNGSPAYVYELIAPSTLNTRWYLYGADVAVALVTIPTDETVSVVVTQVDGDPVTSARVYPRRASIVPVVSNGTTVTFSVPPRKELLVDLNNPDDDDNAKLLVIRTVPLQVVPDETDPDVVVFDGSQTEAPSDKTLYFPAGEWDIGQSFRINSRATVFLHGNAWVRGNFENKGTVDTLLTGSGNWSGEDFDHLTIRGLGFDEASAFSAIYGYDPVGDNFSFAGNTIDGPASWHPGLFTVTNGQCWIRNFASIAPWWYNVNGFDLSPDISDGYKGGAEHCVTLSGDDNFMHEKNYNHYEISDCFFISTASACVHLSYWPLGVEFIDSTTGTWLYDCTALSLAVWDEATETGSIIRCQVDGTLAEGEQKFNRSNLRFIRFHVDGRHDGNFLQAVNKLYQWGGQDAARGQIIDFVFTDCDLEYAPNERSRVRGYDWRNTPSGFSFAGLRIGDVLVTHRNHATYFLINSYPYHINFGGRNVVSAVDVCNTALSYIGERDRVTSIDPVEDTEESRMCARAFPSAIEELMEMHSWSFNTKKIQMTVVNADPDDTDDPAWDYRYEIPEGMAEALAVLADGHMEDYVLGSVKQPQNFHIKLSDTDGELRLYTNIKDAWLRYTVYVTDPNQLSRLAVAALEHLVASKLAGTIVRGDAGEQMKARCLAMFGKYLAEAKVRDSRQRQVSAQTDPPWTVARRGRNPWDSRAPVED